MGIATMLQSGQYDGRTYGQAPYLSHERQL